ncbi:hypothetical protein Tco_0368866 [Tanacetum coccineum]
MLKRGSYIPWASRFRRYLNRKRENRKWLNKAIDEGPYVFKNFTPDDSQTPRLQTEDDLTGDDLKHYEAKIEAMNLILISIPNDIYNSVDAYTTAQAMCQRVKRLMRGTFSHPSSVVEYMIENYTDAFQNDYEDLLISAMMLLTREITHHFSNPTNNRLRTSSNTKNQAIVQGDKVNIQSQNSINDGRNTRSSYVQEEIIEAVKKKKKGPYYARNCPKPKLLDSKYFMEQMLLAKQDEAGVTLTDEHNDFLIADATRMEEIEELSANICLMARIQPVNIDSDVGPSYDSTFLSEVQKSSTSYVNPLFAKDNQEQKYPKQPKIINDTIGDDQIDSNIIFDEPNVDVNSGKVE